MPFRLLPHMEVPIASFVAFIAAISGVDNLQQGAIWDIAQLRLWCLLGSIGGSWIAIGLLPANEMIGNYTRRLAIKFSTSLISGLIFTPIIIRWQHWPVDTDIVLAVSCTVAVMAVSLISALVPFFIKKIVGQVTTTSVSTDTAGNVQTVTTVTKPPATQPAP